MEDAIVHSYCTYVECKEKAIYKFPGQSVYDVCSLCEFHKLAGMEKDAQDNVQELAIPIENDVEIIISQDDNQEIIFETVQKYVINSACSQTPRLSGGSQAVILSPFGSSIFNNNSIIKSGRAALEPKCRFP